MKIPSPNAKRKARIEIIPLIDIMFFLLATFMMVSLAMVKNLAAPVRLPKAATSLAEERKDAATITINEAGEIYYDKERVTLDEMRERLRVFKAQQADGKVFISGDERVPFGRAITILDEVRKIGILRVAIQTQRPGLQSK